VGHEDGGTAAVEEMKRAPEVCPHWPDGKHGHVLVRVGRLWWRKVVWVCPRCNGWWREARWACDRCGHEQVRRSQCEGCGTLTGTWHVAA
jgi:hypothetical protein